MTNILPRHIICALGNWTSFDELAPVVAASPGFTIDREFSRLEPDSRMPQAFLACEDRVVRSMTDSDRRSVQNHRAVAYVLSPPLDRGRAREESREALLLIGRLFDAGATAVKGESSGIAHGKERWQALAARVAEGSKEGRGAALQGAWVRRPISDAGVLYSCGLHLLGGPDVEVGPDVGVVEAIAAIDAVALHLILGRALVGDEGPRRVIAESPCARYAPDDFMFNPYGYVKVSS